MKSASNPSVVIIGAGFSGLAAAICLADEGYIVTVVEKNEQAGGRARQFSTDGFTFDMGPSWYWMPDVFESFYKRFGYTTSDFYTLKRLDPSYKIFWQDEALEVPAGIEALSNLFEKYEPGAAKNLKLFLQQAHQMYETSMDDMVFLPGHSIWEYAQARVLKAAFKMNIFSSFHSYIRKFFKHPKLLQMLEFPVLFLGATARQTPAMYSLMNYGDMVLGTWYPEGGMYEIVKALMKIARSKGVEFRFGEAAESVHCQKKFAVGVQTSRQIYSCDYVVASADYQFVEQNLLPPGYRQYSKTYWNKRAMSPSALIFYLGIEGKLDGLKHHNLFFDADFGKHSHQLYNKISWPDNPLFYVCNASKSDPGMAPLGHENLFVLIPVAPGLSGNDEIHNHYFEQIVRRIENHTQQKLGKVVYKKAYAHQHFIEDYNAFKGNAYGLANTLKQTAVLKPKLKNKLLNNFYYTGQLTVPGPGVPPSLISGQIAANEIIKARA